MNDETQLRIKSIKVDNFKSLDGFQCDLAQFTCLTGLNGAGKTTFLQWIDLASVMMKRDGVDAWLDLRKWTPNDLLCRSREKRSLNIRFEIVFARADGVPAGKWSGSFLARRKRMHHERIEFAGEWYELADGKYSFSTRDLKKEVSFDYQGSLLSQLKESVIPEGVLRIKQFMKSVSSLEMLSPQYIRQRTRESDGVLGLGGQNLSAFLHEMGSEARSRLAKTLREFYPSKPHILTRSLRSGWKQLSISERFSRFNIISEARHINDGMLRVLAVLAELEATSSLSVFDEIENGINPEVIEKLVDRLVGVEKQVIVTTHSPMILNYLDDEVAKESVVYLYRNRNGNTRAIRLFDIPSLKNKLDVMGPGEAFVDTNLTELASEISRFSREG